MKLLAKVFSLSASALLLPVTAYAHTGIESHSHGFWAGMAHPVMGWDHLIALLGFGLWCACLAKKHSVLALLACFAGLITGFAMGASFGAGTAVETGIIASLLITGVLLLNKTQPAMVVTGVLSAGFATFHGIAHGAEALPGSASIFALGFLLTSALLVAGGMAVQRGLVKQVRGFQYIAGAGMLLAGISLFTW